MSTSLGVGTSCSDSTSAGAYLDTNTDDAAGQRVWHTWAWYAAYFRMARRHVSEPREHRWCYGYLLRWLSRLLISVRLSCFAARSVGSGDMIDVASLRRLWPLNAARTVLRRDGNVTRRDDDQASDCCNA